MADWALPTGFRYASKGTAAASGGGTVTTNASANTKGEYATIVDAMPFDASGFYVQFNNHTGGNNNYFLYDIAIGTEGNESILIPNLGYLRSEEPISVHYHFPIEVPAGQRIAARAQSSQAGAKVGYLSALVYQGGFGQKSSYGRVSTYGANAADSTGTTLTTSVANTKGSWIQITAATERDHSALLLRTQNVPGSGFNANYFLVDVAIGAAGSERILFQDLRFYGNSTSNTITPPILGPLPVAIRAGTRIAMRAQTTDPGRDTGFIIYGLS